MLSRILLVVITLFWLSMNVLLWRVEYGGHNALGSTVPASVVWEKILTAPDASSLTVLRNGKKIGFCHWITSISEDLGKLKADEAPPEGMVGKVSNYRVQLEGNVAAEELGERLRFDGHVLLSNSKSWQEVGLRVSLRPSVWEFQSVASDQTLRVSGQDEQGKFERVFTYADLQNPNALVEEIAGPVAAGVIRNLGLLTHLPGGVPVSPPAANKSTALAPWLNSLGTKWEACHDTVKLGHSNVPAFRLRTRILERYQATLFVSRVGEILRVELPGSIVLLNDQIAPL
jgi:hypothetical protein